RFQARSQIERLGRPPGEPVSRSLPEDFEGSRIAPADERLAFDRKRDIPKHVTSLGVGGRHRQPLAIDEARRQEDSGSRNRASVAVKGPACDGDGIRGHLGSEGLALRLPVALTFGATGRRLLLLGGAARLQGCQAQRETYETDRHRYGPPRTQERMA